MTTQQGQPAQRQTIEQERAAEAWYAIDQEIRGSGQENDYGTRAKNLPSMIQVNGLGATLAFLRAKANGDQRSADYILYRHLSNRIIRYLDEQQNDDVMDLIRTASTDIYRQATAEAIAYSIWLKRYVEAEGWKASN